MIRSTFLFASLLVAVPACPRSPTPAPGPVDAAPHVLPDAGTVCSVACANLAELGCKEGLAPNCAETCEHAQAERITDIKPACLSIAHTKVEARACRSVVCP